MAGKRHATTDLNHENWDREEEPEERGIFRTAPEEELKTRVIKKARRKITTDDDVEEAPKSVFSGFSGFAKTTTLKPSEGGFSFLSKIPVVAEQEDKSFGNNFKFNLATNNNTNTNTNTNNKNKTSIFGNNNSLQTTTKNNTNKNENSKKHNEKSKEYCAKLMSLNCAVRDWINTHVNKDALCYLTPIFKDYENYVKRFDEEEQKLQQTPTTSTQSTSVTTTTTIESKPFGSNLNTKNNNFIFGNNKTVNDENTTTTTNNKESPTKETTTTNGISFKPTTSGFSFGKPTTTTAIPSTSSTTTPKTEETAATTTTNKSNLPFGGFSFNPNSTPFTFGNIKPPAAPEPTENDEDEDETPPKVEFKQVVEDDSLYSKRVKVFAKKNDNFVDRGIGVLYLKPVKETEKTQLLVRADTNLGNVLVNTYLTSSIPAQRMGKNNVMLVCIPTPEENKSIPLLFRVKTAEEADELLKEIEKYKK